MDFFFYFVSLCFTLTRCVSLSIARALSVFSYKLISSNLRDSQRLRRRLWSPNSSILLESSLIGMVCCFCINIFFRGEQFFFSLSQLKIFFFNNDHVHRIVARYSAFFYSRFFCNFISTDSTFFFV